MPDLKTSPAVDPLQLERVFRDELHGWLCGPDSEAAIESARGTVRAFASAKAAGLVVDDGSSVLAAGRAGRAAWDSSHFGLDVHRLDDLVLTRRLPAPDAEAVTGLLVRGLLDMVPDTALVFARVSLDATPLIRSLERHGFRLFDAQTTWVGRDQGHLRAQVSGDVTVRHATRDDVTAMATLCALAMAVVPSHLHADSVLPADRVSALYEQWARNSVVEGLADATLVAEHDGRVVGFTTVKLWHEACAPAARFAVLPLVAVDGAHRGAGVGRAVVSAAVEWARTRGCAAWAVGTQANNVPAARLYASLGLRPGLTSVNLHRHARTQEAG